MHLEEKRADVPDYFWETVSVFGAGAVMFGNLSCSDWVFTIWVSLLLKR